ncbi:hypothetical protein CALVIDRAFT_594557 [Calocera viscosa TUFC12733]|uniref:Uncharacterized protein n=1 Tax=Calocera viscosa (strain TUFC12733) TaxID=1330018 RepID=A0A167SG45_CALVF|nr:hypothetical protein CALVIDRAFT_594557 [Calocera viscosa TUFC12733]
MIRVCLRRLRPPLSRASHATSGKGAARDLPPHHGLPRDLPPHRDPPLPRGSLQPPSSSVTVHALKSIKETLFQAPHEESLEDDAINRDIRDVLKEGTARRAPRNQDEAKEDMSIKRRIKLPPNSSVAYSTVPERAKGIFRKDQASWREEIAALANPDHPMTLSRSELVEVLVALLVNRTLFERATRMIRDVARMRSNYLRQIFSLDTLEILVQAADRGSAYNCISILVDIMFRLHFPWHAQYWPVLKRWEHRVPRIELDKWMTKAELEAEDKAVSARDPPFRGLDGDEKATAYRICHFVIDSLFRRHHYIELVDFHTSMIKCGVRPSIISYNRILQSYFRWFLYPDFHVPQHRRLSFPMLMERVQDTLNAMSHDKVDATHHTRSILLYGFTRTLLMSTNAELRVRWAALGPAIGRLRTLANTSILMRLSWTEALLEWEEARWRRITHQKYKLDVPVSRPTDIEQILMGWFAETFKAMQESLKVSGRHWAVWETLTIEDLLHEVRICVYNMRAALMESEPDFDTAAFWFQQMKPAYEHGMKRLSLPENRALADAEETFDANYEAATVRFVARALNVQRLNQALGAMTFAGYIKNARTFVGLWHTILPAIAVGEQGWDDVNGVHKALRIFMDGLEAHRTLKSVNQPGPGGGPGPDRRLKHVFVNNSDHNVLAYLLWTAMVGSTSHQSLGTAVREPDSGLRQRVTYLQSIFERCGVELPEEIWNVATSSLVYLCKKRDEALGQTDLDSVRWQYEAAQSARDPNKDSTFRFFGVKFDVRYA